MLTWAAVRFPGDLEFAHANPPARWHFVWADSGDRSLWQLDHHYSRSGVPAQGRVGLGNETLPLAKTYGAVSQGGLVAVIGSHGWLEVALNGGSAQTHYQTQVGDFVQLQIGEF